MKVLKTQETMGFNCFYYFKIQIILSQTKNNTLFKSHFDMH